MSRVELTFDGSARGAVTAAKQTVEAIDLVKRTSAEQTAAYKRNATDQIVKRVEERRSLQAIAAEYTKVAQTAKRGSEVQVAALKLEQRALRELSDTHGVYSRRLSSSTKEVERFSKGAILGSGALGHMGRTAALASGAFLGGVGLIQVFKDATEGGAALQTQLQRTDKVFGENAASIKAWSRDSVKSLALARAETLDYAASIGTLLQNMGLTESQSAQMSKVLLQRAADVAAFKGVDTGDVVGAFNAGLQGRTRALKQYGIVLDQTAIKQEAERLGLVRNTVDLSKVTDATNQVRIAQFNLDKQIARHGAQSAEAAKATIELHNAERQLERAHRGHAEALTADQRAQATYNAILEQTGKQQGWLAGHVTNLSVQERILKAEEKELFEILGTGIIPMLTKYLPLLTAWIDRNEKNGTFQRDFNSAVKVAGEVVQGVIPVVKAIVGIWKDFSGAVGGSRNALLLLGGVMAGKKVLGVIESVTASVKTLRMTLLSLGSASVIAALLAAAQAVKEINATKAKQARLDQGGEQIFGDSFEGHKPGSAAFVATKGVFKGQTVQVQTINGQNWVMPVTVQTQTNVHATGPGSDTVSWSGDYGGLNSSFKSKLEQCVAAAGGSSINVTSGRRSAAHNTAVGGAHNSNHLTGHAADGTCTINGKSYPLGDAPLNYGAFGLRAGRSFDWGGGPDVYHVDDGTNVGGVAATSTGTGAVSDTSLSAPFVETSKPKTVRPKIVSGTALLDHGLQLALATAHGTPGTADDLRYLKEARAELERLQKTASKAEQVPIARELASVNRQITAIDTANLKSKLREVAKAHRESVAAAKAAFAAEKTAWQQHVRDLQAKADEAKQVFEASWQRAADRMLSAFDDVTSRQLTSMGKATSQQLSKMQADAKKAIDQLQVTVAGSGFASFLFGGPGAQTPTELLLAQRAAAKQVSDDIQSVADARKNLADAQAALAAGPTSTAGTAGVAGHDAVTLASGDTVTGIGTAGTSGSTDIASLQQAVVDAQKQLDDAIYQQETDDLQTKAQLERDAADRALTDAQNTYQDQADLQQQAYQDQQDAAVQAYQDQRTIERQNITDWLAFQEAGLEAGTIQWTNFYAQLVALAGANGLAVGAAFWGAWQDAQNTSGAQQTSAAYAQLVASYKPETAGSWQGLVDANGVPVAAGFQGFDASGKWTGLGFASGGWADRGRPRVDPRDTIPALLRRGEYVMSPEEVAAGGPSWGRGGQTVGDVYLDGQKVGVHVARHVTDAQERSIGYMSPRG